MKSDPTAFLPVARLEDLIVKEVDGEVLIYDCVRDKAHCLNHSAAQIWRLCTGENTLKQIAYLVRAPKSKVQRSGSNDQTVELVWFALEQLRKRHLLEEVSNNPATHTSLVTDISRREVIKRLGITAIVAIPVVTSIAVPTAQAATSCKSHCMPCSTGECCSGVCSNNNATTGCTGSGPKCL